MLKLTGIGAAPGVALGDAHLFGWKIEVLDRRVAPDQIDAELRRLGDALAKSDQQLQRIQKQIADEEGDAHQHYQILEAHRLMLKDQHLEGEARRKIREEGCAAEWAVRCALNQINAVFDRIEDPYFRDRRYDIDAVGERVLRNLLENAEEGANEMPPGSIAYGHDIPPSDMTQLGRGDIRACFTEAGGKTSHSAVVARALGIPLVVGVRDIATHLRSGTPVIVDGTRGEVILDPDAEALRHYQLRSERDHAREESLAALCARAAQTLDGTRVHLAANVELLPEVPAAVALGAESVGLFRTEFLYLERDTLPTEDEQYAHAVSVLRVLDGRMATMRTLDLGGDKLPASIRIPAGANPALGLRSIRYSLWQRDVFKAQLRAFYRAAAIAPLRILFPMISGVGEYRTVAQICAEVRDDLAARGVDHDPRVPLGVMVETPSAAVISDLLARECDFLTIGTNDLIQYTLAADRQDEHVGYLYHPLHPAILRLIKKIVDGAHSAGKPVAMCGDMAGDPSCLWILLALGLRDLSMAPRQIPVHKSMICKTRLGDAQALLDRVFDLSTVGEVEELVNEAMERHFPELAESERESIAP